MTKKNLKLLIKECIKQMRLNESDWKTTQEHNGKINDQRRQAKEVSKYLSAVIESPNSGEYKAMAQQVIKDCAEMDKIIAKGYLDSGYQYDDQDPRNNPALDNKWDDSSARTGSSKEAEIETEIRHEITSRHLASHLQNAYETFTDEVAQELWPNRGEFPFGGEAMGLRSYIYEWGNEQQHDDRADEDHGW